RLFFNSGAESQEREEVRPEAVARSNKFRILVQTQITGDRHRHLLGSRGLDLALNRSVLDHAVFGRQLRLRPREPLGVDDHVRLSSVSRRRDGEVDDSEDDGYANDQSNETPLPAEEVSD